MKKPIEMIIFKEGNPLKSAMKFPFPVLTGKGNDSKILGNTQFEFK